MKKVCFLLIVLVFLTGCSGYTYSTYMPRSRGWWMPLYPTGGCGCNGSYCRPCVIGGY